MKQLTTRWGRQPAGLPFPEYPRPALARPNWLNLNGLWQCAFTPTEAPPTAWGGSILVPYSPEAALSGVGRQLRPGEFLWYRRSFSFPAPETGRVLLHFGAVDQTCRVWVNGLEVGGHTGGYLPFTLDITAALHAAPAGGHELVVRVQDETDAGWHSRGKQKLRRGGMFYTAQSGIWQTVWLEPVPENAVDELSLRPDYAGACLRLRAATAHPVPAVCRITSPYCPPEGPQPAQPPALVAEVPFTTGQEVCIPLPGFHPWSPEDPFLYGVSVAAGADLVTSYFAVRQCAVQRDQAGVPRTFLNGRPYLQLGVLDQGYWPEGLYTPPSDEAMAADILSIKELGFNLLRKHVKLEPQRWYYHCDRLGMLVWQDMVCGGSPLQSWFVTYLATLMNRLRLTVKDGARSRRLLSRREEQSRSEFLRETQATVRALGCHPSIVCWVPFNEGWGQFDALRVEALVRRLDPTRLVDHASGWFDQGGGSVRSLHHYFFKFRLPKSDARALALTEFGGCSLALAGHCCTDAAYGYGKCADPAALTAAYEALVRGTVLPAVQKGLCVTVYTQLSDIEDEVNGIYTYDREILKLDGGTVRRLNKELRRAAGQA
ncbi:glycoside hydrolase family 2 protein [Allofournierella sp.]|uniref:glycoside hydrolase family 2 protein n=1 Tax=Allofournierella sp. TaxID=1940256 RepID=UPI003AB28CFB